MACSGTVPLFLWNIDKLFLVQNSAADGILEQEVPQFASDVGVGGKSVY